jgi:hypothetical protein
MALENVHKRNGAMKYIDKAHRRKCRWLAALAAGEMAAKAGEYIESSVA